MTTISIPAKEDSDPKTCGEHGRAVRNGDRFEFRDASEEQLAFWNALTDEDREELSEEAYDRCFFDALTDAVAEEQEKYENREEEELGTGPQQPGPVGSPPVPSPPNQPPTVP